MMNLVPNGQQAIICTNDGIFTDAYMQHSTLSPWQPNTGWYNGSGAMQ